MEVGAGLSELLGIETVSRSEMYRFFFLEWKWEAVCLFFRKRKLQLEELDPPPPLAEASADAAAVVTPPGKQKLFLSFLSNSTFFSTPRFICLVFLLFLILIFFVASYDQSCRNFLNVYNI